MDVKDSSLARIVRPMLALLGIACVGLGALLLGKGWMFHGGDGNLIGVILIRGIYCLSGLVLACVGVGLLIARIVAWLFSPR